MAETQTAVQEYEQRGTRTAGALNRSLSNASVGLEEFNWDEAAGYNAGERDRLSKLYERTLTKVNEQQIVKGTVVTLDDREVVVNIGFKSEGVIPIAEFRDLPALKPGDTVEVYLETIENKAGHMVLSRKTANSMRSWEKINQALDQDLVVEGVVKRRTKGGFVVDVEGVEAFLPGSQIDVKPVRDYDSYVGRRMEFKVVKINHQQHNVVISHKALIEKDIEAQKAEIIGNLQKGQVLEGTVKNVTSFGVFIDLGGVDGLLHITDISWGRISSPDEVLKLDQKLNVVVLDFDDEKRRISLGLKQLQPHPWENLPPHVAIGSKIKGRIVTIADYGVFVEVVPGVEGLVHVSEMSWSQHPKNPSEMFNVGQEIEAVVLTIDTEEKKMSLGLKQLTEDPWMNVPLKYPLNSRHTGTVRNITNFGLFVELEEGVDGLVHIQDLTWTKKVNHPSELVKRDDKLEVIVLELDTENRKLRLGHKQLTEDPWITFENVFPEGSVHQGTITRLNDKGANVELPYGIEGFAPVKQLTVDAGKEKLKEGDSVPFVVAEFNKEQHKIILSHTRTWQEGVTEEAKPKAKKKPTGKEAGSSPSQPMEKETLGDHSALADLKAAMDSGTEMPAKKKGKKGDE